MENMKLSYNFVFEPVRLDVKECPKRFIFGQKLQKESYRKCNESNLNHQKNVLILFTNGYLATI